MALKLPDPREVAQVQADYIRANRQLMLEAPLERVFADAPFLDRQSILEGLEKFHRERMQKVPSAARYPESPPWVDYALAVDWEVRQMAGLTETELAVCRSLPVYLQFRGYGHAQPAGAEKCRAAYLPESDHGRIQMKNVDDPATNWKPEGKPTRLFPKEHQTLWSDGVGNGLHLDDEPDEIFPLPIMEMYRYYAQDVPSAVEFLQRYSKFWGGANILLHDKQKRSVAIEKCSYNFIEVFYPGPDGRSYISGMTCRDPESAQGAYQRAQRQKYLKMFQRPDDCADNAFWGMCWKFEQKLKKAVADFDKPAKADDVIALFTKPWPAGLQKTGQRIHPDQGLIGYTLATYAYLLDENKLMRWQRSAPPELTWPDEPEVYHF